MQHEKKYGNMNVYTLSAQVSNVSIQNGSLSGDFILEDFSFLNITGDTIIEFSPPVFRLVPHSQEIIQETPWLIQLQPVSPNNKLFMLSVGGEYIDDIELSDLSELIKKIIFI